MSLCCSTVYRLVITGMVSLAMVGCAPIPIDPGTLNPGDLDTASDANNDSEDDASSDWGHGNSGMPELTPWVRIISPSHNETVMNPVTW